MFNTQKLANSEKCRVDYLTDTKWVCNKSCLLLEAGASNLLQTEYVSPDDYYDRYNRWTNETNIYDDNILSTSGCSAAGYYIELYPPNNIHCSGVRIIAAMLESAPPPTWFNPYINIDVFIVDVGWQNIFSGIITKGIWVEKEIGDTAFISAARIKFNDITLTGVIYEFDFLRPVVLDVTLHNGFSDDGDEKHRMTLLTTGNVFNRFDSPVYFSKGMYVKFAATVGNVFVRYLIVGEKEWSIQQVLQRRKLHIPGLRRFVQWCRLIRDWFIK
ncbi:hypothetical protein LCGC14_0771680 [marine sediment metagenome]|uniref:Uncharacterized protein n=1 Tax=marine sediment metagenome TaxID=412755 RepID=A0A0F9PYB1_9ZZZZ